MNLRRLLPAVLLLPTIAAPAAEPAAAPAPAKYPIEAYVSLGSNFARDTGLNQLGWTEQQFNAFIDGLRATYRGRGYVFTEDAKRLRQDVEEQLRAASEISRGSRVVDDRGSVNQPATSPASQTRSLEEARKKASVWSKTIRRASSTVHGRAGLSLKLASMTRTRCSPATGVTDGGAGARMCPSLV